MTPGTETHTKPLRFFARRRFIRLFLIFWVLFFFIAPTSLCAATEDEGPGTKGAEETKERSFSTGTAFFDDAVFSGGIYYMHRSRSRRDLSTGNYKKNLDHITAQASGEINSGFIGDFLGFDFGAFASSDLRNQGAIDHEMNFTPWRDPWHMDWTKVRTKDGTSVYKAHLKVKAGPFWGKAGYFQPSGPGVLGVNWSFLPGTWQGAEAGADFGNLSLAAAWANEYKAPWYTDTYEFLQGDGKTHIAWVYSLGARYRFDDGPSVELAYGESQGYLRNAHVKIWQDIELDKDVLSLGYHFYGMADRDDRGRDANDNFEGIAYQHYLYTRYTHDLWTFKLEGTYTWTPIEEPDQRGYFAYRLTNPTGSSKGAYDCWWDARSDWDHHKEKAVYGAVERRLDDLLWFPGVYAGFGAVIGWDGVGYGVSQRFKEWAFNFDLGYIHPDGPLAGAWVKAHYTEYRNGTGQPDWGPYKNAFQDEHDFKFMIGIPFSL